MTNSVGFGWILASRFSLSLLCKNDSSGSAYSVLARKPKYAQNGLLFSPAVPVQNPVLQYRFYFIIPTPRPSFLMTAQSRLTVIDHLGELTMPRVLRPRRRR